MITLQEIKRNLECSDVYAQKLIDDAQGDEKKLEDTYYRKLALPLVQKPQYLPKI